MSTPPNPAPPPAPRAPPATPAPGRPKKHYLVVAVAAAIGVLLVAFFVLSTLMGSSSGSGATILTYSGAQPVANHAVASFQGGGWTPLIAVGLDSATTETYPVNTSVFGNTTLACTYTPVTNVSSFTLPGYAGNRSSGEAPAWEFAFASSSEGIALVSVIDGQAVVLGTLTGGECGLAWLVPSIPGTVVDSSQAGAAVRADAQTFLTAHPNASAAYVLGPGVLLGDSHLQFVWSVVYSTCAVSPSAPGTGDQFNATVNALTGQVVTTHSGSDVSCRGLTTATSGVRS